MMSTSLLLHSAAYSLDDVCRPSAFILMVWFLMRNIYVKDRQIVVMNRQVSGNLLRCTASIAIDAASLLSMRRL